MISTFLVSASQSLVNSALTNDWISGLLRGLGAVWENALHGRQAPSKSATSITIVFLSYFSNKHTPL